MSTLAPGSKVLVTGCSGFIAAWVARTLLERGFRVRGTVRSEAKGRYLADLFEGYAAPVGFFEWVVVPDVSAEGAFDKAVDGVDAVAHTASPYHFKADDPNELIEPAVKGTRGILESILAHAPGVKRVVITSSLAAIIEPPANPPVTLTEKDWNALSIREVEAKGREASQVDKYRASKTLAERAAWDFVEKHRASIGWDVVALNPPLVWGPTIHEVASPEALNTSIADIYAQLKGTKPIGATPSGNEVDVRDLASAHVNALLVPDAGGRRFLLATGPFTWQDFWDAVNEDNDETFAALPRGEPGKGREVVHPVRLDTSAAREVLGMHFRPLGETARESVRSLLEREKALGW